MASAFRGCVAKPFTPELGAALIEHARAGLTEVAASVQEKLHRNTLASWLKQGRADAGSEFAEFARAWDSAQAENAARSNLAAHVQVDVTPELTETICETVRRGNFLDTAGALVGISRSTLGTWLRRGAREEAGPYAEFTRAVRLAQAEAEAEGVSAIQTAARSDWKAVAWLLARLAPDRWGDRAKVELTGEIEHTTSEAQERLARKVQALVVSVTRAELPAHEASLADGE